MKKEHFRKCDADVPHFISHVITSRMFAKMVHVKIFTKMFQNNFGGLHIV